MIVLSGFALSACAAGHIKPFSKPVANVSVGLTEAQTELQVTADGLARTPWQKEETDAAAFTVTSVFSVLVDGLGSLASGEEGEGDAQSFSGDLTPSAQAYLKALERNAADPALRLASLETHLTGRIKTTRRFLTAASQVIAAHRLAGRSTGDFDVRKDLALIAETATSLEQQHETFAEVMGVLMTSGQSGSTAARALGIWQQDIAALDLLSRSVAATPLS